MVVTRAKAAASLRQTCAIAARLRQRYPFKVVLKGRCDVLYADLSLPHTTRRRARRVVHPHSPRANRRPSLQLNVKAPTPNDSPAMMAGDDTSPYINNRIHPGTELMNTAEMIGEIIFYVDWPSLMALSKSTSIARRCVRVEIRMRINSLVGGFISKDTLKSFFDVLQTLDSVIVGSVARRLLAMNATWWNQAIKSLGHSNIHPFDFSFDLNIIVPFGKFAAMRDYLSSIGFGNWKTSERILHYDGVLYQMEYGSMFHKGIRRVCSSFFLFYIILCMLTDLASLSSLLYLRVLQTVFSP